MNPEQSSSPKKQAVASSKQEAVVEPGPLDSSLFEKPQIEPEESKMPTDTYSYEDKPVIFTFGKYKGQEVDRRFRRSLELVEEKADCFVVNHFYHAGEFYRAEIPRDGVQQVIGQRFNFGESPDDAKSWWPPSFVRSALNHAQTRFILSEDSPVRLYPLGSPEGTDMVGSLTDFVYTLEAVGPEGVTWSSEDAYGDLVAAHRFLSTSEVYFERTLLNNYLMRQTPPLLIPEEKLNAALELSVNNSVNAGTQQPYYLWKGVFDANNCTSEPFKLLDHLMRDEYTITQKMASALFKRLPIALRSYLGFRGVLDRSVKQDPLHIELEHLKEDPEFRQRLKALNRG